MMFLSHLLFGILSGYIFSGFLGFDSSLLFIALAASAATLPDIDSVSSKLGRKLPPFAVILNFLFHHRGFMHSLIVPVLLYLIISRISQLVAAAVMIGYVSHLLLDAATTTGVRFLYPLPFKIKGVIRTNSFVEKLVVLLLIVAIVVVFSGMLDS